MSYILEALRKADAQRERDPARGIHARPAAAPAHAMRAPQRGWWGAVALLVAGAGAGYAYWQAAAPRPAPAAPPVTGFVKQEAAPAPLVTVATELSPPAPPALPAPRPPMKTAVASATLKAPPAAPAAASGADAVPAASAAAAPAGAPPATAPAAPERIFAVADLPQALQGELPKLAISGGVHSQNAAQRLLIVGGQLKTEGAELAPGLVLEQIRPRTAVLRFKGYRYSVPY